MPDMTAPDSRDSVERIAEELRAYDGDPFGTAKHVFRGWADRLQALSRGPQQAPINPQEPFSKFIAGPQQAGGEDAKDAARYRWIRQHFKATFHRSTSDYWLIQGEHKTPAAVFRDGMDLTLDAAIDAARLVRGGDSGEGELC